jgi:hypothetical protein
MNDSGNINLNLVLCFLQHLPSGVTEIYFHPASHRSPEIDRTVSNYQCEEDFATLTSSALGQVLRDSDIQRIVFSDL